MIYFLILGGNKGNSKVIFNLAINKFKLLGKVIYQGKICKTAPFGIKNQKFFYNQGIILKLDISPFLALKFFQRIEKIIGKKKKGNWGPRFLDIDIVYTLPLYNIKTEKLRIPHTQIYKRDYAKIIFEELKNQFF